MEVGVIYLDGKPYPVELATYRKQDITDFSPRASLPGGQIMYSELGLYQSLTQDDWQYGFGFEWHIQNNAYLKTVGNIDTRQSGFIQRMTQPTDVTDASSLAIDGFMLWDSDVWGWSSDGLVRLVANGDTVNNVYDEYTIQYAFHTGEYIIALPKDQQPVYSTSGDCDQPGKAFGFSNIGVNNADLFFQAYTAGTDGCSITITYESGGTAGAETVALTPTTNDIVVTLESGVSLASQIKTAIEANSSAYGAAGLLGSVAHRTGHDGSGACGTDIVSSDAATALTLANGSSNGAQAQLLVCDTVADAALLFTAIPWGDTGNQYTVQFEDTGIAQGSEFVEVTDDAIRLSFDAATTAKQAMDAVRQDVKVAAKLTTQMDGKNNDLVYTAVDAGPEGNRIAIEYAIDASVTPSNESVECDTAPSDSDIQPLISVHISPNSIATQVMDTVNDDATASGYVSASIKPDETGAGKIKAVMNPTRLSGGTSGDVAEMVTIAKGQGDTNTGAIIACAAGALQGGSGVRSWITTGQSSDSINYSWGIVYDGYVYCGVTNTNRVHYTNSPDLKHIEGTTDDPGALYVGLAKPGSGSIDVLGAHVFAGQLLFFRPDGVWRMDKDRTKARRVLDYSDILSTDNFRSWCDFQGQLVYTIRNELYMWNGTATNRITPGWTGLAGSRMPVGRGKLNVRWPYVKYGHFDNLCQVGRFLFCTARTNDSPYVEDILCYDGVGWHKIHTPVIDGASTISAMIFNPADNRLYYHIDNTTTAQTTHYIQFQSVNDLPYDSYATSTGHYLVTSRYDAGFRDIVKSTPSVLVEGTNLSTNHWMEVYYSLDGADSWYPWGGVAGVSNIIDSDGITELFNPLGIENTTLEYYDIQYRIFLLTSASTGSPVLQRFATRLLMRPDTLWGWAFRIPVVAGIQVGTMQIDNRTTKEIIDDIDNLRKKTSPVEYEDIWGVRYLVHITSMDEQAVNYVSDDAGPDPNIEMRVNVSLAELG